MGNGKRTPHNCAVRKKLQNVCENMFTSTPVYELNVCNVKGKSRLSHLHLSACSCESQNKITGTRRVGEGCHAFHPCLAKHAWHSGGHLDGTVSHMANHSSNAEVFSKGPGSNLKRGCLHRGQRPSGQKRPSSCWPRRDRHINS